MAVKLCPKCNGKVAESREDCPHCGYVFIDKIKCPECDAVVDKNFKECPECGHRFEDSKKEEKIEIVQQPKVIKNISYLKTVKDIFEYVCIRNKLCSGDSTYVKEQAEYLLSNLNDGENVVSAMFASHDINGKQITQVTLIAITTERLIICCKYSFIFKYFKAFKLSDCEYLGQYKECIAAWSTKQAKSEGWNAIHINTPEGLIDIPLNNSIEIEYFVKWFGSKELINNFSENVINQNNENNNFNKRFNGKTDELCPSKNVEATKTEPFDVGIFITFVGVLFGIIAFFVAFNAGLNSFYNSYNRLIIGQPNFDGVSLSYNALLSTVGIILVVSFSVLALICLLLKKKKLKIILLIICGVMMIIGGISVLLLKYTFAFEMMQHSLHTWGGSSAELFSICMEDLADYRVNSHVNISGIFSIVGGSSIVLAQLIQPIAKLLDSI